MPRRVDRLAAILLIALALAHTAVGLAGGGAFTERRLWFLAGGLALALAGALNLVAAFAPLPRTALIVVLAANLAFLAFVVAFAVLVGAGAPQGWPLVAVALWLTIRSARL